MIVDLLDYQLKADQAVGRGNWAWFFEIRLCSIPTRSSRTPRLLWRAGASQNKALEDLGWILVVHNGNVPPESWYIVSV